MIPLKINDEKIIWIKPSDIQSVAEYLMVNGKWRSVVTLNSGGCVEVEGRLSPSLLEEIQ
jgi:hypothetical protein